MTPLTSTPHPGPEPTVLRARSPEDVLAVVPVVLGFEPTDSVVMLTFGGRHQFHARVDLPPPEEGEGLDEMAAVLLDPASRHGVSSVVLLIYSDDAALGAAAWRALRHGCRGRGIDVVDALRVEPERYYPLLVDGQARGAGVPYDIGSHPFQAQAVLDGRVTRRSRDELAATIDPAPDRVERVAALVAAREPWPDEVEVPAATLLGEGVWVEALVERHLHAGTTDPTDADVARLVSAIALVPVRDAAWSCLDRPRARAAVAFWTDVLRRTPEPLVPPVASLLGWSAWQAGDGALAWCALDRCAEVDPDYSLRHLLAEGLTKAVPPSAVDAGFDWRAGLAC